MIAKPAKGRSSRLPPPSPEALLAWYDRHRRELPWRAKPGAKADPYRVWLSEIMLQQTTIAGAWGYYERFLARWPDLPALAEAPLEDVLALWAGLGYYARARNLHRCAQSLMRDHGGRFPESEAALLALPGIGAYTAAAIAAIAFDRPANVVDGNVERVMARLHRCRKPLPGAKADLRRLAAKLAPAFRPGDYAQALMDLGATICRPRRPLCTACPWSNACAARKAGDAESLPRRSAKKPRPQRFGALFILLAGNAERGFSLALRRRRAAGLLGGMLEMPGTDWRDRPWERAEALAAAPASIPAGLSWATLKGRVDHGFTHFTLTLDLYGAKVATRPRGWAAADGLWAPLDNLTALALPSLMQKALALALPQFDPAGSRRMKSGRGSKRGAEK